MPSCTLDEFEMPDQFEWDLEAVTISKPSIQDLLDIIKQVGLGDTLPQAMMIIELAAVIPLTSVHCERAFSPMKRVVSASELRILQKPNEMLLLP